MKKLSFFGLAAMTILFGACTNAEPFDPNGGGNNTDYTQPAGQGTESDPYNVSAALVHNMDSSEVWVKGYIVGQVAGSSLRDEAEFEAPFHGQTYDDGTVAEQGTNLLIAAKADETSTSACLVVQLSAGQIRDVLNLVENPTNDGKEVMIKGQLIKYFGAAGLKNTTAAKFEGQTIGTLPDEPVNPGNLEGDGSKTNPYTAADVVTLNRNGASGWVKAFIVGQIAGKSISENAEFDAPFTIPDGSQRGTNLLIAADANETNTDNCIAVQLPGNAVRDGINLPEHPEMDGKEVMLYGSIEEYFLTHGVKNVTCAIVEGVTYGTDPGEGGGDTPTGNVVFSETFLNGSLGDFTAYSVEGEQVWGIDTRYGAKMSGYVEGTNYPNEDWLISPAIDLSGKASATIVFEHAINFADMANLTNNHTLWVSDNYNSGDPSTATWTQVTIASYASGNSWTFSPSGDCVVPSQYLKAGVRLAFKYMCDDTASSTWEIKNLNVYAE